VSVEPASAVIDLHGGGGDTSTVTTGPSRDQLVGSAPGSALASVPSARYETRYAGSYHP